MAQVNVFNNFSITVFNRFKKKPMNFDNRLPNVKTPIYKLLILILSVQSIK